ncbi:hypothetical protein AMELA_G00246440, partial [Ameiurus melas]
MTTVPLSIPTEEAVPLSIPTEEAVPLSSPAEEAVPLSSPAEDLAQCSSPTEDVALSSSTIVVIALSFSPAGGGPPPVCCPEEAALFPDPSKDRLHRGPGPLLEGGFCHNLTSRGRCGNDVHELQESGCMCLKCAWTLRLCLHWTCALVLVPVMSSPSSVIGG